MKKFINNIKASTGDAEKTKDEEADKLAAHLKEVHSSLKDHSSALAAMKKLANDMISGIEKVAKAFTAMAASEKSDKLEALAKAVTEMATKCKADVAAKYTAALEKDEVSAKKLGEAVDEARKLEEVREKKMKSYDVARFLVKTKEDEYKKKGKVLEDSKNYKEEVADREKTQKEYEEANKTFKEKAGEALKDVDKKYLAAMKEFLPATAEMFQNFQKAVAAVKA